MMRRGNKSRQGAALLITTLVVTAIMLVLVVSMILTALENNAATKSFSSSIQTFYTSESSIEEALTQLRHDPNSASFPTLTIGDSVATTLLTASQSTCLSDPQCQYEPGTGWWGEYFNYSRNDPDMEDTAIWGGTPSPTQHYWYTDPYKKFERIDVTLLFGDDWYPFDGTQWEDKEGFPHDYHFGAHWRAKVTAPSSAQYAYELSSDDDSWVLTNGIVTVNNSGVHGSFTKTGAIYLSQGDNVVEVYFAERHSTESGMTFLFSDPNLIITPWPEGCDNQAECSAILESNATSSLATRKTQYSCDQLLASCQWRELAPGN